MSPAIDNKTSQLAVGDPLPDPWIPHITVATVVEKDGQFLLVEELSNGHLVFNQPAGHLEPNESLAQAAVRETREETGWRVELKGVLGLSLYTSPHNQVTYHRTTFIAEPMEFYPEQSLDEGIVQALWMSYKDICANRQRMRSPLVIAAVEQYRAGHRYPLALVDDYR